MIELRPYQKEAVDACIRDWKGGTTRQLCCLPTGAGKTICFGQLTKELGMRTLILAHREELLNQAIKKMRMVDADVDIGMLKASEDAGCSAHVCVGSVQSVCRDRRLNILKERNIGLCIVDEAHHSMAASYQKIIGELGFLDDNPEKLLVGVTATGYRGDGLPLGDIFEKVVYERTILSMIRGGYLVDARGYAIKTAIDLNAVHTRAGDFAANELAEAIDTPGRNGMIVEGYLEHAENRRSICFCVDVQHSKHVAEAFNGAGISAAAVWGDMGADERAETLNAYQNGDIQVLSNCMILTEGFDDPATSAVLLARPTKSQGLYVQMAGRGLRTFPDKSDCLILDFVDIAGRHDLCSFANLIGDPRVNTFDGECILDAVERVERQRAGFSNIGPVVARELDLFGRSDFAWTEIEGGHYRIPAGEGRHVWVWRSSDVYAVFLTDKRFPGKKQTLAQSGLDLGYAQGVAEDYVRRHTPRHFASKDAGWRQDSATDRQIELLRQFGIPHNPDSISRGEASALIDLEMARRDAEKLKPATSKQMWFIQNRLGMNISAALTKGAASALISEAKQREGRHGENCGRY